MNWYKKSITLKNHTFEDDLEKEIERQNAIAMGNFLRRKLSIGLFVSPTEFKEMGNDLQRVRDILSQLEIDVFKILKDCNIKLVANEKDGDIRIYNDNFYQNYRLQLDSNQEDIDCVLRKARESNRFRVAKYDESWYSNFDIYINFKVIK